MNLFFSVVKQPEKVLKEGDDDDISFVGVILMTWADKINWPTTSATYVRLCCQCVLTNCTIGFFVAKNLTNSLNFA